MILASNSQARAALLLAAGIPCEARPGNVREPPPERGERLERYLARMARLKAEAARASVHDWVLAADTGILFRGRILGKPGSMANAKRMLCELQGRSHILATAVCLLAPAAKGGRRRFEGIDSVTVRVRRMSPQEIRRYVASAKPVACAGAYALQGGGAVVLRSIDGDPTTVIGLPMSLTQELLARAGFCRRLRQP